MGDELNKLRQPMKPGTQLDKSKSGWGVKRRYFQQNADVIFDLIENYGIKYPEILEAMAREGITFTYEYFRRLMAKEKKRRLEQPAATVAAIRNPPGVPSLAISTTPAPQANAVTDESKRDISPERAAFIAENERIKKLNISSKEKRALLAKASEEFSKTQNPLNRK